MSNTELIELTTDGDNVDNFIVIISDISRNKEKDLINYAIVCYDKPNKSILLRYNIDNTVYSSLYSKINNNEKFLDIKTIKTIINNVFIAVNKLCEKGNYHGCLCPSNILIDKDNNVVLKNYCLYMIVKNERLRNVIKEEEFIYPELRKGEKLSKKSDIWCFGKLIEYLLKQNKGEEETIDFKYLKNIQNNCLKRDIDKRMEVELLEKCLKQEKYYSYILNENNEYEEKINELKSDKNGFNELVNIYLKRDVDKIDFFFLILGVLISLDEEEEVKSYKKKFLDNNWFQWLGGVIEDSTNYHVLLKSVRHAEMNCFVRNYPLTKFGTSEISKYSKYLVNLEKFECRSNEIGDEGLINLCKCFTNLKKLRSLDISDNGISDKGICELVNNFEHITGLDTLIIDECKINSKTFQYFCTNLCKLDNLLILSLNGIKIGKEGSKKLNKSLMYLNRLTNLSLMNCGLKENVVELKEALSMLKKSEYRKNTTPRVDLNNNGIDDASFIEIYEYLMKEKNTDIKILMNYNLITKNALKTLKRYKKQYKGKLYLLSNFISYDDYRKVDKEVRTFVDIETSFVY